ncbi:MAG: hypothetical protein ACRCXK_05235 [Wohlfahrtiimonas sp.]
MKKIVSAITIISALLSFGQAESMNIPNDWVLESINQPAKSVQHKSTSPYGVQNKTIIFNEDGYMNKIDMNYQIGNKTNFISVHVAPYNENLRYLLMVEKLDENEILSVDFNNIQTLAGLKTQEQLWKNERQSELKTKKLMQMTNYNSDYNAESILVQDVDMPIVYLDNTEELDNIKIKPNTMYMIVTETDEHDSWTRRMSIQKGAMGELLTTIEERTIEYYDILL